MFSFLAPGFLKVVTLVTDKFQLKKHQAFKILDLKLEVLSIPNDILQPGKSYSKLYGIELRLKETRYNEILVITNAIEDPKRNITKNYTPV